MPLNILNLSVREAAKDLKNRILNPFQPRITPGEVAAAHSLNDFKKGFIINELLNNKFAPTGDPGIDDIILNGDRIPQIPFTFGGTQKLVKDYYPGNSEPTVQVLGPRETNLIIRGRLMAKNIKPPSARTGFSLGGGIDNALGAAGVSTTGQDKLLAVQKEQFRKVPAELTELIDAMRIRGNLVRLTMGAFQRFGFIEETEFNMKTLADIEYSITFSIIGFNPPKGCKIHSRARKKPTEINKTLIDRSDKFRSLEGRIPSSIPRSLGDQISESIGLVADSISLVTGFVDTVLDEVDDIKSAIARSRGLITHSGNQITSFHRRIGGIDSFAEVSIAAGGGIASGYTNAAYLANVMTFTFSLSVILASLSEQLRQIALTEPLIRHRIQEGDTLQKLASKFYNDFEAWKEIYDHNKLQDTDLSDQIGEILEIPRINT